MSQPRPVIHLDDVVIEERPAALQPTGTAGERFASRMGLVGARIGARLLGYNITEVPPGKCAFPLHNHHANEEMFFILAGQGELRLGAQTWPVRQGDFIANPPGGPDAAHQLRNTGEGPLRYLAVSTMIYPEVVEYPDSGKLGVMSRQPQREGGPRVTRVITRPEASLDYWEGE